jgi:hypothetical protein
MAGATPLLDLLNSGFFGKLRLEHLGLIASNDDRMNQVVFANGNLWGGVNTVVKTSNGPTRSGIAYFIVTPSLSSGSLSASIVNQGYVSVNRNSVAFPSIGVNTSGKGVMTFTLVWRKLLPQRCLYAHRRGERSRRGTHCRSGSGSAGWVHGVPGLWRTGSPALGRLFRCGGRRRRLYLVGGRIHPQCSARYLRQLGVVRHARDAVICGGSFLSGGDPCHHRLFIL